MTIGEIVPSGGPTGGTTWDDDGWRFHEFLEDDTLEVPSEITYDLLIQDGGGGGGQNVGGGGGAGAQRELLGQTLPPGSIPVVVGVGGAGSTSNSARGSTGGRSSFNALETVGGGGGGGGSSSAGSGNAGGSGGGGALRNSNPGGAGTAGEGHDGGDGAAGSGGDAAGGGGGAGSVGADGVFSGSSGASGDGGTGGVPTGWSTVPTMAGGGGGGGFLGKSTPGDASDGGGLGGVDSTTGLDAQANRGGGGGGGGSSNSPGGAGGSGRVVIRYELSELDLALHASAGAHLYVHALDATDITGWTVDADSRSHRLAQVMRVDLPDPDAETWRVELLDRETWQPPAGLGPETAPTIEESPPTWELSSASRWGFTVGPGAPMAPVLRAQQRPPDLTARLWRGPEIIDQGPVTDIAKDPVDGRVKVTVESIWHHMVRNTIGPAETPNHLVNPDFSQGLTGWTPTQTDTIEGFPFLVPTTPGAVSVVAPGGSRPGTPTGRGRWARLRGDLTDPQPLALSQVRRGIVSPTDRDIMIRALAVFYLPAGASERTNQNIAVAVGAYPAGYSFPQDSFIAAAEAHRAGTQRIAEWPEPAAQGRFLAIAEQVTLRAGSGVRDVVVTLGAPFADCLVTGVFMTVSDALVAQGTVTDVFEALVAHGQDTNILGHVDHGLSVVGVEQGELPYLDEEWGWHDHTSIGSAVDGLVSGGLGEWRVRHHMTGSTVEVLARDIDGVLADSGERLDITVTDRHHPSWIASLAVRRDWSAGSTTVVAQSAGTQAFHERGAVADDPLGWTDIVTMPDHVPPWRAGPWAQRLLDLAEKRDQVLISYGEDAPRTWHRLRPGARCQVNLDVQGVQVSGRMLVRSHQLQPGKGGVLSLTEVE